MRTEFDLCVIGGGPAGLVAAAGGALLGAKVALIEKKALGGDCLYYGCVPSKTLLHSAKVAQCLRRAGRFGLSSYRPAVSLSKVMQRVQEVIKTLEPHDSPERFRSLGVEVIFGSGRFTDPQAFVVNGRAITAKRFVLATGSRPALPPVEDLERVPYLTNETVFSLQEDVPRLILLGGGPVGCELAQAFARLGSQVDLVEYMPQLLPKEDPDLAAVIETRLREEGIRIYLKHSALRVEGEEGRIRLLLRDAQGVESWLEGSHLLVATGRRANLEGLGLEEAFVRVDNGRVLTDRRLRTSNRNIYACGDLVGPYQFTHVAEHQAGVVLRNALFHWPARVENRVIPWCTFTDPELARVGLSEQEAKEQGLAHRVYTFPFQEVDRAVAEGEELGLAKIITTPGGKLLGAALAGPQAGELIHEYVLALERRMKVEDLTRIIHIYPTLAQINRRVAEERLKQALTPARKKWLRRLFGLRGEI